MMRKQVQGNDLIVHAVAGTYVVMLGWDITADNVKTGLLGFALQRIDLTENETHFMRGMKTFPGTSPQLPLGGTASSHEQPFQSFQWADYAAKPGHSYSYTIIPMYGRPGDLTDGPSIAVDVKTESELDATHSVFFNRGAVASQEYARRFQNKRPSDVGQAAYDWLSRGLIESIIAFLAKAAGGGFGLRIAIYEFQWAGILDAVHAAADRGADVKVLFDAIENANEDPVHPNEEAIATAGIDGLCQGITVGKIMHNKFIVLLKDGKPVEVLTGSTNYTENGLFGHLNCAHIVSDADVARTYFDYWQQLEKNQALAELRVWDDDNTPAPPNPPNPGTQVVFSPQAGKSTLARYGEIAGNAQRALFMTFAFGMNNTFVPVYQQEDDVLRFALMDKEGSGKTMAEQKATIEQIRQLKNAVISIGQNITLNEFDRWLKEASGVQAKENVRWVHTKFMLVDPLSDDPIVITGSANFSDASVNTNQENMLVIRGDTRVADIYLGEFMRQFSSYAFRDAAFAATHGEGAENFRPQDLFTDNSWIKRYEGEGTSGALRRLYFSGQ
jgi:phosphatidylserine/phosphatidylglycerophosphate/cardiolipin synthase-like enzyme